MCIYICNYLTYVRYVLYGVYMPDVKVYIRTKNLDKWKAIANKSKWINTLLAHSDNTSEYGAVKQTPVGPVIPVLSETLDIGADYEEDVSVRDLPAFKQFLMDYKFTGTHKPPHPDWGYPCCWDENKRCQHWEFDDVNSRYVNKFTHEVVDVL